MAEPLVCEQQTREHYGLEILGGLEGVGDGISVTSQKAHGAIDALEFAMLANLPVVDCPVTDHFVPGMYAREIFMPAGTLVTSKIHKTEHLFVVSKGKVAVYIDNTGVVLIEAPYSGVTLPGTRRVLYVIEDTVWTTFHPTDKTTVEEIEEEIIERRELPDGSVINDHYKYLLDEVWKSRERLLREESR